MSDINVASTTAAPSVSTVASHTVTSGGSVVPGANIVAHVGSAFVLVMGVIFILNWLIKRSGTKKCSSELINVRANYALSPKDRIVLLDVDNKLLVVGITQHHMTLLHTIDGDRAHAFFDKNNAAVKENPGNHLFAHLLHATLKRGK